MSDSLLRASDQLKHFKFKMSWLHHFRQKKNMELTVIMTASLKFSEILAATFSAT